MLLRKVSYPLIANYGCVPLKAYSGRTIGSTQSRQTTGAASGGGAAARQADSVDAFTKKYGEPPDATYARIRIPSISVNAPLSYRAVTGAQLPDPSGPTDVAYYDLSKFRTLFLAGERCDPNKPTANAPSVPPTPSAADIQMTKDIITIAQPFGIVVLEAWSAGRAVIANRVGGDRKIIKQFGGAGRQRAEAAGIACFIFGRESEIGIQCLDFAQQRHKIVAHVFGCGGRLGARYGIFKF